MNTPDLLWKSVAAEYDSWSGGMVRVQSLRADFKIANAGAGPYAPEPMPRIRQDDGSLFRSGSAESSAPGLHFMGSSAIRAFGPIMRSLYGAGHTARAVTQGAGRK